MDAKWEIGKLKSEHVRKDFCCGKGPLDEFIKTLVSQYAKKRLGKTYVAVEPGSNAVVGYYTVSTGSIAITLLPESARKQLPKHPIPTLHLGRLAVDRSVQGKGLGRILLFHFLYRATLIAEDVGLHAIDVRAKDAESKAFYEKYGFAGLEDDPLHLFLPMKTVESMFRQAR